jgi:hypothetical protein
MVDANAARAASPDPPGAKVAADTPASDATADTRNVEPGARFGGARYVGAAGDGGCGLGGAGGAFDASIIGLGGGGGAGGDGAGGDGGSGLGGGGLATQDSVQPSDGTRLAHDWSSSRRPPCVVRQTPLYNW